MVTDVKEFIREVEQREPLWKTNHKHYYNKIVVHQHWVAVAALFNVQVYEAKQKWKNLRDTFRAELKKARRKSFQNEFNQIEESKSTWTHYQEMSFLTGIIRSRMEAREADKLLSDAHTSNASAISEKQNTSIKLEVENSVDSDPFSPSAYNDSIMETQLANDETEEELPSNMFITTTGRGAKRKNEELSESDDDMLFFRSLLPFVKKLDLDKKLIFRTEVQKKLYDAIFK